MNCAVRDIPAKISQSLSALSTPQAVDTEAHAFALRRLELYEVVLDLENRTLPPAERMRDVVAAAEAAVLKAFPNRRTPLLDDFSIERLKQYATELEKAAVVLDRLSRILDGGSLAASPVDASPTGVLNDLPDLSGSREVSGSSPSRHRAYVFAVFQGSADTFSQELEALLGGPNAERLVRGLGIVDKPDKLAKAVPPTLVALFLDSNNKPRDGSSDSRENGGAIQSDDFSATGYRFADDRAAALLCARIHNKAQNGQPLSEGERELHQRLKDGYLRIGRCSLFFNGKDRLCATEGVHTSDPKIWALGSPLC